MFVVSFDKLRVFLNKGFKDIVVLDFLLLKFDLHKFVLLCQLFDFTAVSFVSGIQLLTVVFFDILNFLLDT